MSVDRIRMYVRRGGEAPHQEEQRELRGVNKDAITCWFGGNVVPAARRTASLPQKRNCVPNVKQRHPTLEPILHAERPRTIRVAGQGASRQLDPKKTRATTPSLPAGAVQKNLAAQQSSPHLSWKPKAEQRVDVHSMVVEAYSDLTSAFDLTVSEVCSALRATASRDRKIFDADELTTNSKATAGCRVRAVVRPTEGSQAARPSSAHVGKGVPSRFYSRVLEKESSLSRPAELLREFISPREMNEGWRHRVVAQYVQTPQFLLAGYSTRKALCAGYIARGGRFERGSDPRQRSTSEERHRVERSLFKNALLLEWDFPRCPMRGERLAQMKRQERTIWLHMATDYTFRKGSLAHLDLEAWHYPSQSAAHILRALVHALRIQGHRIGGGSAEHLEQAASGNTVMKAEEEASRSAAQHHAAASKTTPGMGPLFQQLDANADGKLTRDGYNTGFDTIDTDKNGFITRKEFGSASARIAEEEAARQQLAAHMTAEEAAAQQQLDTHMAAEDTDRKAAEGMAAAQQHAARIAVEEEALTGEIGEAEKTTRKSALAKFNSAAFKLRMVNRLRGAPRARTRTQPS